MNDDATDKKLDEILKPYGADMDKGGITFDQAKALIKDMLVEAQINEAKYLWTKLPIERWSDDPSNAAKIIHDRIVALQATRTQQGEQ